MVRPADEAANTPAGRPWREPRPPARILAIRLQALGDVTITLPYLRALQRQLPETTIDFLTREDFRDLPQAVSLFRRVEGLAGGRHERVHVLAAAVRAPRVLARRYDVVIDLQNNRASRIIRRAAMARAWSSFDRFSPRSAGERTRLTIEAAGFPLDRVEASLPLRIPDAGLDRLTAAGWDARRELVILNPAGAFPSRHWPVEHYIAFARTWRARRSAQVAILGLPSMASRAAPIRDAIGDDLLNLIGVTSPSEALGIVQRAALVVSEDSGLMHMAWTSGVPTLALFGSSRHDWSAPIGAHTLCLHSGDLECGACMDAVCRYGDVHCLTRYSPDYVVQRAEELIARSPKSPVL